MTFGPVRLWLLCCNSHVVLGVTGNRPILSVRHVDVLFLWLASQLQTTLDHMSDNNHHHQGMVERSQGCGSCWSLASPALRKILKKSFYHCYVNSETLESNWTIRAQADPRVSSSLWIWKPLILQCTAWNLLQHITGGGPNVCLFTTGPPEQTELKLSHNGRCSNERSAQGEVAFNMFFLFSGGKEETNTCRQTPTKGRQIWETLKLQGSDPPWSSQHCSHLLMVIIPGSHN